MEAELCIALDRFVAAWERLQPLAEHDEEDVAPTRSHDGHLPSPEQAALRQEYLLSAQRLEKAMTRRSAEGSLVEVAAVVQSLLRWTRMARKRSDDPSLERAEATLTLCFRAAAWLMHGVERHFPAHTEEVTAPRDPISGEQHPN